MKLIPLTAALLTVAGPLIAAECTKEISDLRQSVYLELLARLAVENPALAEKYAEDAQEKQMAWMADTTTSCELIELMVQDLEANYLSR